jgi:hypothetical protein
MGNNSDKVYDIFVNPKKYGAPTFEEFVANKDKWKETLTTSWGHIDQSSNVFKNRISKQVYKFKGYKFDHLETVERVIWDHGINPLHCTINPQVIPDVGGKCSVVVEFVEPRKSIESILKL